LQHPRARKFKIEKTSCSVSEKVEMNFLKNQITDAGIDGQIQVKVKTMGKLGAKETKVMQYDLIVEDSRWLQPQMFEIMSNPTIPLKQVNPNSYQS
jgi:hypothetical protein